MSMSRIIKPLSEQIALTAANTVSNAVLVYVFATNAALLTITDTVPSTNVVLGSLNVGLGDSIVIEKLGTSVIAASAAVSATSIKFRG